MHECIGDFCIANNISRGSRKMMRKINAHAAAVYCVILGQIDFFSCSSSPPFLFGVPFFLSFRSWMDVTLAEAAITRFLYSINIEYTVSRFLF